MSQKRKKKEEINQRERKMNWKQEKKEKGRIQRRTTGMRGGEFAGGWRKVEEKRFWRR